MNIFELITTLAIISGVTWLTLDNAQEVEKLATEYNQLHQEQLGSIQELLNREIPTKGNE